MIIEKIDIKSFGLIRDMTLEFSDSVNVIEGQNEAGKSTIAAFIRYMFFGFSGLESDEGVSERKKRLNWDTGIAQGSMIVRVKDKRYIISRSTVPARDSAGRESFKEDCSIIDMDSGATSFGKIPAGEVFFGVSLDLFENTAFVGQIGDSAINEGSVRDSIENILFSGSERLNTQRAVTKVGERMEGLIHANGQGGVIFDLLRKKEELIEAMEASNENNKQILAKETELYRIRAERKEAEEKLERLRDLDDCYKNVMLIQTFDQLHALEEDSVKKAEAYAKFIEDNTREGYVPDESYLSEITIARRGVNDAYEALVEAEDAYTREKNAVGITREIEGAIELSDELGGEKQIIKDAKGYRLGVVKNVIFSVLSSLVAVAAAVVLIVGTGVLAEMLARIGFAVVGVLALVGAVTFAVLGVRDGKRLGLLAAKFGVEGYANLKGKIEVISEARAKRDGMIRSTENARVALEKARIDYDNARRELTKVIVRWGETPPTSDINEFLDNLEAKVSAFLEKKRILLEEKTTSELTVREIRRTLSDKNEIDIRALVSPLRRKVLSGINHDDIITGIAALRAKIAEEDKLAYAVENELIALRSRAGDPATYYVKLSQLEARITELRAKHKAYFVAKKALESATENLRAEISPRLGEYSTKLMAIMTDEKYKDFEVSNGLKVTFTSDSGVERSVDYLSGGTRDLAYIAVRMALIDMLYSEMPPVCFDESFAHQDNNRARAMMRALVHLADEGIQSFVFTCRGRESLLAEEMSKNAAIFKLSVGEDSIA